MADNHAFLEPNTAAPGATLRTLRAVERADGALVQTAILYAADGETALIGRAAAAASLPVALSTEDAAALAAAATPLDPATQTTLAAVLAALQGTLTVDGPLTDAELRASAVPVSLDATPLPTGAATEAAQTTGNSHLATLAGAVAGSNVQTDVLSLPEIDLSADALTGQLASLEITLSNTPGTVTSVTIPDTARGIRLYPRSDGVRFAVGEDPAAVGASSSTTIAASAFGTGGIAKPDQWETRLLEAGTSRTVRLRSTTADVVVDMEVF